MCIGAGDICFKGRRRFPKARSPNLAQSGFAKTEDVACSKRSDSGERCEVEKAMKSRGGLGREVREFPLSPLLLPRFYFFALLLTSHRSPLSQRLEQAGICMNWEKTYCFCNVRKWKDFSKKKNSSPYIKCASVTSLLYGPWTNLWLFYGLYCQRFSHYIHKFHSP